MTSDKNYNLALPFYEHSLTAPDALAVSANGIEISYKELTIRAQKISVWLQQSLKRKPKRVGILASRSIDACAALLGTGWAGGTYVPISLKLPEDRLRAVLKLAELDALIIGEEGAPLFSESLLEHCPKQILVHSENICSLAPQRINNFHALPKSGYAHFPVHVLPEELAYIIFTSGSTGVPKGVMICSRSLRHHAGVMQQTYQLVPNDRIAETADISFDLSVGNMFMTWHAGASLHVVPSAQMLLPLHFIRSHQLTIWYSVPSIISLMRQMHVLKPGIFPTLRYSLFIGEPLPMSSAVAWQRAANNSILENLYGPTEATVACTRYRLENIPTTIDEHATVPIGEPLEGTELAIVDTELNFQPRGIKGELALSGIQLAQGYFKSPETSQSRFPIIDGKRWYLTGDAAMFDAKGILHHCGRIDHQVKVLGYRIELEDIEAHLRAESGSEIVAAVAWPLLGGSASGLVGFVSKALLNPVEIKERLSTKLPSYMVPSNIYDIPEIPLSPNGKVDRALLKEQLKNNIFGDKGTC